MRLTLLLSGVYWLVAASWLIAQPSQASKDAWQLIPPDGVALVTVHVKSIVDDESNRMMPWEVVTALTKQQLGLDPLSLERVDLVACAPGVAIRVGALLTFQQDLPANFFQRFELQDAQANKGVELYRIPGNPDVVMHQKDSRHVLVGTKPFVMAAVKTQPGDGPLRALASSLGEPSAISVVLAIDPIREVVASFLQSPPIPAPLLKDVQTLINQSDMIAMRVVLGNKSSMATLIQTKSPADAPEVSAAMSRMIKVGTQAMVATAQQQTSVAEGNLPQAVVSYMQRLAPEIEKGATFKVTGNRLLMTLDGTQMVAAQVGVGVGLLLPAVQAARTAARRMQSVNNLKQMCLAVLNYESAYRKLPLDKDIVLDQKSQFKMEPNLSWRVHILPFIEQQALYKEFHLDEPWDSPHNIKLLERMPLTYRHPQSLAKPGYTVYQQPTGDGLIQTPMERIGMAAITDGTANTICILETTDEAAVPWTKPGDVNPLTNPEVTRNEGGIFNVVMVNGAVHSISTRIDPEVLKALLTRAGGEVSRAP